MLNQLFQSLDPVAFAIGPFVVRWYGLAYIAGFVCAYFLIKSLAKRWRAGIDADGVLTIVVCVALCLIVCARLGYCLFYGDGYYLEHPAKILAVNEGGMSFHGGLVGAILGGAIASRILHVPFMTLADLGAIVAPVGIFFGRCANFVNGELWGKVTTLPWGVVFPGAGPLPRHPSQLYEALLEGVVIFVVLYVQARRVPPRPRGTYLGLFCLLYGIFRFAVEFVRVPDAQLGYLFGGVVTMGQVLSLPVAAAGIVLLIWAHRRQLPQAAAGAGDGAAGDGAGDSGGPEPGSEDSPCGGR